MGISNCSGPCELCVSNGHCLAGRGDDDFKLDDEKFKSIMENWWNTYVVMPVRRGLRLDQEADESKEEKHMLEEKNVTNWLPCVVSDGTWSINEYVKKGDHIYRIFNDKFDIKANMTIKSIGCHMICVYLIDQGIDIPNIVFDESLRVCQTSSENDPGTLLMRQTLSFNEELKPGCLYRVIDSELNFKYLMYIRRFTGGYIDADIMKPMIIPEEMICGDKYSVIETKHEQLSIIDLRDMMFKQISLGEGCNFKFE